MAKEMRRNLIEFTKQITDEKYTIQHKNMINKFNEIKFTRKYCIQNKKVKDNRLYVVNMKNLQGYLKLNYPHFYERLPKFMGLIEEQCYINTDGDVE